ncbi:hypothetical protein BCR42DRAFT_482747 [Absidia repens]|uniref:Arf-GAP domain-containing protein n=1 Tax=Absidia repens TaxID=90262 RepID=A0A1X2IHB6_9FUNG|nr:hypothetical protein BCR42DRAFT_482747 [Absidia repens]
MSTRYARTADKAQNEKNTSILKGLLKQPGNKYCADCRRKDPRWASWNLGIFVCIRCSGIHRSMGTHISKVKSVDLDSWIPSQIESMEKWGNERANLYWEANLKDNKPNESNMDMWIRSKYDTKRWAMKGPIPDPSSLNGGSPSAPAQQQVPPSAPKAKTSAPPKATVKKTEFNSLDDFFGSSPSSSSTTTNIGNGSNGNHSQQEFQGNDIFSSMDNNPAPAKEQPKQQIDFKSSILSLYNKQPAAASTPSSFMGNSNNFNTSGNYQQQLSGLGGFSSMPSTNTQASAQDNNNGWGSFVSSSATTTNSLTSQAPNSQIFAGTSFQQQQQQQPKKQSYDAFADLLN